MKKYIFLFGLLITSYVYSEQELFKDQVSFLIPCFVEEQDSDIYSETGRVTCEISKVKLSVWYGESNYYRSDVARSLIEQEAPVTTKDVYRKFEENNKYVLIDDFRMSGILLDTYRQIKLNNNIIGEIIAVGCYDGAIYTASFAYKIKFVINDYVYIIRFSTVEPYKDTTDNLIIFDDIFYKSGSTWFFHSYKEGEKFHNLILDSDLQVPARYLELNIALRWLLETLEIDGQHIEIVDPLPVSPYSVGVINDDKLRVRTEPVTGEVLGHVNKNDRVIIIGKSATKDTIDTFTDYWYKVKFGSTEGWIYGGYVDVEERDVDFIKTIE